MKTEELLINPKLPKHFFNRANDARSQRELSKFWYVPFILFHEYEENDTWVDYEYRCREFSHEDFVLKTEVEFNQYHADQKTKWFTDYPTGIAYVVHCLDGGAWDRPTWWGDFSSLEEAKACCENGPSWRK